MARILPGVSLMGVGGLLFGLMLAFPERLRVPPVIGYFTAATFILAGMLALANAFGGARVRAWLAVALLACMVLPSAWIAFGPGERACSFTMNLLFTRTSGLPCRAAFGIGAVLGVVLLGVAVRHALREGRAAQGR